MLDDLRKSASDDFDDEQEQDLQADAEDIMMDSPGGGRFLGLTAVERMLMSILLFVLVTVIGVLLLLATGRIAI